MSKNITCKQCGQQTNNGTNFCNKKCRRKWNKKHNYKAKDWKQIEREYENELMGWQNPFDCDGNCYPNG